MIEKCNTCKYSKNSYCTHPDTDNKNAYMLSDAYPYWEPIEIIKSCENCGNMDETCSLCTDCRDFSNWIAKEIPLGVSACPTSEISEEEPPKRGKILKEAMDIINGERQNKYGNPEDSFNLIGEYWSAYLKANGWGSSERIELTPREVAEMMMLFKIARMSGQETTSDNYVDLAGYAGIAGDMVK